MHELGLFQDPPGLPGDFATWRISRSGLWWVKTSHYLEFEMFHHPAEAVTRYTNAPPDAGTPKSMGGFTVQICHPVFEMKSHKF